MSTRSYRQYCGLARALDIVGERWSLLIVRELLGGPARYTELSSALSGIATNLLADRLRDLAAVGVVERRLDAHGPGAAYALTAWGEQLREPIEALVRWSTPLMRSGRGDDAFQGLWLAVALRALLRDSTSATPVAVGLDTAGVAMTVALDDTGPRVVVDPSRPPSTVLRAEPDVVLALAAGAFSVEQTVARGAVDGDRQDLAAVFGTAR